MNTENTKAADTFKTRAPFRVGRAGGWQWHTWTHNSASKHAAIRAKAAELGATAWDFGQADHAEADRAAF